MEEDKEEEVIPVLCDDCSEGMLSKKNWLGTWRMENSFECLICHRLCCEHLLSPEASKTCRECAGPVA